MFCFQSTFREMQMHFDVVIAPARPDHAARAAAEAERLGFGAVWTSETAHNPFLPLTHAATTTTRLALGTGIAVAFPRSPMVTAQTAWDLAAQSDGRFILGLGTQVKQHITKRFSSEWGAPVPKLREYIESLRAIWRSFQQGESLRYSGEFYQFSLMTPFFNPGPIAVPHIPIYIAGVNEGLCALAGEAADGFHVHPFHTVEYLRSVIRPAIAQGAAAAGRDAAAIATVCALFVVTGRDDAEMAASSAAIRAQIAFYASTPTYSSVLELHGWGSLHDSLNALSRAGRWNDMGALITDEVLDAFAVVAPADRLAEAVRARYHGLLDRVAYYVPFNPDDSATRPLWHDAARVFAPGTAG
jgi:probable F420-dependent oxidoreductase